jgi:tetratricopeptide (TPR) repeat protein
MRWIAALAVWLSLGATARADDWGPRRDPFDPVVVGRYKAILAHDPHDDRALGHLVDLYRRYRTLAKLEAEYRARLDAGEDWATLVVLARLRKTARAEALALWKRVLAAKRDDARAWLALGDASPDVAAARDAYLHAAELAAAPRDKRAAWTKAIGAARLAGDAATVDAGYAQLVALSPNDGALRLDRGDAQLAAKRFADAEQSFATAETLLRADPDRRLAAMLKRGVALEGLGRADDAIAAYARALDAAPSGYYLGRELVARIVDVERRRGRLAAAIERFEARWPARARGYFEWATLGALYEETHDDERAIDAYRRAVGKSPIEVGTQRKLIALLDRLHPDEALAQHEAAARVAPGDADLQLALAKRYGPERRAKALATLDALARRSKNNASVRAAIAELYERWDELERAIGEYAAIVAIEPDDPDHAVVLGDAYWRAGDRTRARAAWQRLDKIGTPAVLLRHADVLAMHESWDDAAIEYGKALALDATRVEAWRGRARANEALGRWQDALDDARRAVALIGVASHLDGLRDRQLLVRELDRARQHGARDLEVAVRTWRFAFDRGDVAAGYLLAAHHARIVDDRLHDVLVQLYGLAPADDSLGIAVARSFERRHEFARARQELERISRRSPKRAEEVAKLIAQVDEDRERYEHQVRWEAEGRPPRRGNPDLVGRDHLTGIRLELGGAVRDGAAALVGIGVYRAYRVRPGTAIAARFDWTQRDDPMGAVKALAIAADIATRVVDARAFELGVGVGPRVELRYGNDAWNRGGIAADAVVELHPRALPVTLGLRVDQSLTDAVKSTAVLVELGLEVRK